MIFGTAHMNRCKYRLLYCAHCWSEVGRALGRNCSEDAGVWSQKVAASAIALLKSCKLIIKCYDSLFLFLFDLYQSYFTYTGW